MWHQDSSRRDLRLVGGERSFCYWRWSAVSPFLEKAIWNRGHRFRPYGSQFHDVMTMQHPPVMQLGTAWWGSCGLDKSIVWKLGQEFYCVALGNLEYHRSIRGCFVAISRQVALAFRCSEFYLRVELDCVEKCIHRHKEGCFSCGTLE